MAQRNRWYARQRRSITNQLSKDVMAYHETKSGTLPVPSMIFIQAMQAPLLSTPMPCLYLFAKDKNHQTRYGVVVDNSYLHWETTASKEYSFAWKQNVIRNYVISATTFSIDKPGKHTLKLIDGDPGMVIQKVVIDLGGMKKPYLGPQSTFVK